MPRPRGAAGPALRFAICLVSICLVSSCVTKGKYDALEESLQQARKTAAAEAATCDENIASLEDSLEAKRAHSAELDSKIRKLESELSETKADLEASENESKKLNSDLATVVSDRSQLEQSVEEMETALAELSERKRAADRRISEFQDLLERFQSLIDAGRLQVRVVDGRMVVQMATDVLFGSGSASLSGEGQEAVKEVAEVLAELADRRFQVEGHTDNVPIRTAQFPSNWQLASARAITVVDAMIEGGVPPENVSAASFGEHNPAADNETPEGRAANRRIEIVLLPDLSTLPGFDELERLAEDPGES